MRGTSQINQLLRKTLGIEIKKSNTVSVNQPIGMVEVFSRSKVIGWVSAPKNSFPIKVDLCLNGFPIVSTWADVSIKRTTKNEIRSFFFSTYSIWDYCNKKHKITVEVNGQILPMHEIGVYRRPGKTANKDLSELKHLLNNGYVFDNFGKLQLSKKLDTKWQSKIIDIYNSVAAILEKEHKITPFLIYGSLLGQVREGGFIGHDGDFDIAYISKYKTERMIINEMKKIALCLINAGFDIRQHPTGIHIHSSDDYSLKIDLFHVFFDKNDVLQLPFGIAGTSKYSMNDWQGLSEANFSGFNVMIPTDKEKFVEHLYGSSWRIPIAGFNWHHARTSRAPFGYIPDADREEINSINKKAYRTRIAKKFDLTNYKDTKRSIDFILAILSNNMSEATISFNKLLKKDRSKLAALVNDSILYDKSLEWTSHGVTKTFRFWKESEKVNYIEHTMQLIDHLQLLSKDVCLGFGSVLAIVRDKDLIPHDDDMDIIIGFKPTQAKNLPNAREAIAAHLKPLGYELHGDNFAHWQVIRDGYKMDVFAGIYDEDGTIGWYPGPRGKLRRSDVFPAKKIKLLGVHCLIPKNPNKYLEVTYGKSWQSPQPSHRHTWNPSAYNDLSGRLKD